VVEWADIDLNLYQTTFRAVFKMTLTLKNTDLRHTLRSFLMSYDIVKITSFVVGVREPFLIHISYVFQENTSYVPYFEVFGIQFVYEGSVTARFFSAIT